MSNSLIPSFLVSDVSESLRLLNKNVRYERIVQVAHQKKINSLRKPMSEFPALILGAVTWT